MKSNSTMPAASRKLIDYTQQRATLLNNSQPSLTLPKETTRQQLCHGRHHSSPSLTTTTMQPSRRRSRQAREASIPTFHKQEKSTSSSLPTPRGDSHATEDNLVHFFLKVKRGDSAARYSRRRSQSESPTRTIRDIILGTSVVVHHQDDSV